MRFAYADPPYFGCAVKFYGDHPEAAVYDTLDGHRALIDFLVAEYPDGWAYSLSSVTLRDILPLTPRDTRVMSWGKPFASFKPGVGLAYTWEPVLLWGGRPIGRDQDTVRDFISCNITLRKGLTGAKPPEVCHWIIACLNAQPDDTLDDLFPGTGIMGDVWAQFIAQRQPDMFIERVKQEPML